MLKTWNPWQELEDVQRRLNRAVRSEDVGDANSAPATDIVEDGKGRYLYLDLADVDEGSLEVTSEQNSLNVRATHRYHVGEQTVYYQGRPKGSFSRTLNVLASFDLGKVTASYDSSVLTLLAPRSESIRLRKIEVGTGQTHRGHAEVGEAEHASGEDEGEKAACVGRELGRAEGKPLAFFVKSEKQQRPADKL